MVVVEMSSDSGALNGWISGTIFVEISLGWKILEISQIPSKTGVFFLNSFYVYMCIWYDHEIMYTPRIHILYLI